MERTTQTQVEGAVRRVNRSLEAIDSGYYAVVQARNGGTGVDLAYLEDGREHISRTLAFGTKREVCDYLYAMATGLEMAREALTV